MKTEVTKEFNQLTKHPQGSVKELLIFSLPLMLSFLSENIMLFFDRIILARYSLEAMNAAAAASFFYGILQYGSIGIATIAELFVSQFYSKKDFQKISSPVWQMVWFSLFSSIIYFSIAIWFGELLLTPFYREEYGLPYFKWMLYFGPLYPMLTAFSAFFIGIGRTMLITIVMIVGNITNIFLDLVLIFGVSGYIPSMGTKGAALATGGSHLLQIIIILCIFFNSENRKKYHTTKYKFHLKLFLKCIRIGIPNSFGYMLEMTSWAVIARLLASVGEDYLTVMTVGQSLYTLVAFTMDGLQRGISIICAGFIANKKTEKVFKSWKSGAICICFLAIAFSTFMVFYPDPIIEQFLISETLLPGYENIFSLLRQTSIAVWAYLIFYGFSSISTGILITTGDTAFILLVYALYSWGLTFTPIYVLVFYLSFSPAIIWEAVAVASFVQALCLFIRFKQSKWIFKKSITDDD